MEIRLSKVAKIESPQVLWCVVLLFFFSAGCKSPSTKVAEHMSRLRFAWETNLPVQVNLPEKVLDWPSAVEMMLQNNLKIRQARNEMTNAQENARQVYMDLIPTLTARAGVTKRFSDLANLSVNDVTLSADSFFNVPGVVNFSARLYESKLYQLRAEAAYQLSEREQMVDMYRLFFDAEELREQHTRIEMERATAMAMEQADVFSGRLMQTEMETRQLSYIRDVKNFQDRASDLLGSREYRWVFSTAGLPNLQYQQSPLPLSDTNRVAQLQMRLLAVELEAARAQLLGLKLRYWPELNIFVSSPPIYARQFGRDRWWDAQELQASADLFWNIDTRGNLRRVIRQTARQQDLQLERYRQESLALMNRLVFTQEIIGTVQKQLERVEGQLAVLLAVPPAQNYTALDKYSTDYRTLTQQQLQLKRQLSELNALFWFVDEDAWRTDAHATPNT